MFTWGCWTVWCWFILQHLAESCIYKSYFVRIQALCLTSSLQGTARTSDGLSAFLCMCLYFLVDI